MELTAPTEQQVRKALTVQMELTETPALLVHKEFKV
jgi:hypothetical protein